LGFATAFALAFALPTSSASFAREACASAALTLPPLPFLSSSPRLGGFGLAGLLLLLLLLVSHCPRRCRHGL